MGAGPGRRWIRPLVHQPPYDSSTHGRRRESSGALVLVSHDRHLIDRVTTEILALDGNGRPQRFADRDQWDAARRTVSSPKKPRPAASRNAPAGPKAKRRTYKEQREWLGMEDRVLAAEARLAEARASTEDPSIATDAATLHERMAAMDEARREVDRLYDRWAELEDRSD